jgi:signal transduction histidine kinase/CheY-like chemotaxis protein
MGGAGVRPPARAFLATDHLGRILDASDEAARLLEYAKESFLALNVSEIIGRMDESVLDLIIKATTSSHTLILDALCYRKNGTVFPAEVTIEDVAQIKPGVWIIGFVLQDSRSRRGDTVSAVEARLARAERLEMAGTLAGQIAHDFNNLLTPLLAYPELIRREVPSNKTVIEYLDVMEKTTGDMTRLTHQLLSLARRGQAGAEMFDINDLIEQVVKLMQTVMPVGISVELDLDENLLGVKGSKDQMRRVLENLCQNAVDAMGGSGTLQIRTENIYLDEPVARYGVVNVGEYVKVSVMDSGPGIPDAVKDKIFDPFFTTKRGSAQRGSGLGLSIVHGIMRDHKGYVDFETAEGKGTNFFLYLPIMRQALPQSQGDCLPHGTESILVVDDDERQVQVLVSLIKVLGYSVAGVTSGREGLKRMRDGGERYDLVILDMVMEMGMDGLETFIELRKLNPHQRVILMSGFTKAARNIAQAQQMGAGAYLRKPLTIESVATTIRRELDVAEAAIGVVPRKTQGRRILIVDDEPMIRKLFSMIIFTEFRDVGIDQAANGREAVDAFKAGRHELIVMDLQMPMGNGREAFLEIGRLCSQNSWPLPKVIFCTGFTPPQSLDAIINDGGAHCLLRKPVKADALLHAVRQRLRV